MTSSSAIHLPRYTVEADTLPDLAKRITDSVAGDEIETLIDMMRLAVYVPKKTFHPR